MRAVIKDGDVAAALNYLNVKTATDPLLFAALVSDETTETYKWVLGKFLKCMEGKQPQAVITDGDGAMREAIKQVFPDATHRLCAWHLNRNAGENVKKT
ncbi:hypothetical protein P8452_47705 [Trifolium repens]|nr:hypothetical protein P8452_47705 [Trifolium repens]